MRWVEQSGSETKEEKGGEELLSVVHLRCAILDGTEYIAGGVCCSTVCCSLLLQSSESLLFSFPGIPFLRSSLESFFCVVPAFDFSLTMRQNNK